MVEGRLSVRDEKLPQMVINEVRAISQVETVAPSRLYLKLPTEGCPADRKVRAILSMFPGQFQAILYFADTGVRRGTSCSIREDMLEELRGLLGKNAVILK